MLYFPHSFFDLIDDSKKGTKTTPNCKYAKYMTQYSHQSFTVLFFAMLLGNVCQALRLQPILYSLFPFRFGISIFILLALPSSSSASIQSLSQLNIPHGLINMPVLIQQPLLSCLPQNICYISPSKCALMIGFSTILIQKEKWKQSFFHRRLFWTGLGFKAYLGYFQNYTLG